MKMPITEINKLMKNLIQKYTEDYYIIEIFRFSFIKKKNNESILCLNLLICIYRPLLFLIFMS